MIEMHIHISLDKDTDAVAEGAKLKELLNTALVGDFSHVCSCGGNCQEEDPNQVKLGETFEPDEPAATQDDPAESEEANAESEAVSEEPKAEKKTKTKAKKDDDPEVKIEDVRAVLADYRAKGGDLKSVLKPYGAKLTDVKKEDYPALLKDAAEALCELEDAE